MFEKIFPKDKITKRERVELTLNHRPVDRAALHDQVSFNPGVISLYTGKQISGFNYTLDDICAVIRQTLDMCFPPVPPRGTNRTEDNGWIRQNDNWTSWLVSRPFNDVPGAGKWLAEKIDALKRLRLEPEKERREYRDYILDLQAKIGETVICAYPVGTGLCGVYSDGGLGLEIFSYFYADYPEPVQEFLELSTRLGVERIHAIADRTLSPVILIAEDFATKQGPIFNPAFLEANHFPYVRRLVEAWHEHGIKVIYHSDGNYRKAVPALIKAGCDGFYCLEPNSHMDIVDLKKTWPQMVWAGGLDGVDLLERGAPEQVKAEVRRQIRETNALRDGGIFIASSSEINPPVKPENFKAMVDAVGEIFNNEKS